MTDTSSASKYGFALAVALLAAPGSARAAPALSCPDMATQTVPASAIGLPTTGATVTAAINVTAGGNAPQTYGEYCQVNIGINPVDPAAPKFLGAIGPSRSLEQAGDDVRRWRLQRVYSKAHC